MSPLLCQGRSICWTAGGDGPHQLRDVLAKLDIDASIGEAELLKTISSLAWHLRFACSYSFPLKFLRLHL